MFWIIKPMETFIQPDYNFALTLITAIKLPFDCQSVFYNTVAEFGLTLFYYFTAQTSACQKKLGPSGKFEN